MTGLAPCYNLSDFQRDELTREFLSTKTYSTRDRFACFEIEGGEPFSNIARQMEREVFQESFGNDAVMLAAEYKPYENSSLFFLAVDTEKKVPAGAMRMIRNSSAGLKTLVDLADSATTPVPVRTDDVRRHHGIEELDRCWDGATATVPRRYRRSLAAIHLQTLFAWYAAAVHENVEHFVSILDAPVYMVVQRTFGLPIVPLADTPPFSYMGSECQAVYAHVPTTLTIAADGNRKLSQKVQHCFAQKTFPGLDHPPPQ